MGATDTTGSGAFQTLVADDISSLTRRSWEEIFSMSRAEVADYQLSAARRRFGDMLPRIAALRDLAERHDVTRIDQVSDVVPLLFDHTAHKSYPMSVLENGRFDMLTKWLQRLTAVDLSGIDASACTSIDDWMGLLELHTPLQIYHTSGTSGKLSFFPRTVLERDFWGDIFLAMFQGMSDEPGTKLGGADGERMPVIYPSLRYGRYMSQRLVKLMAQHVAPTPEQMYTLSNGTLSADLISLAGRVRVAQAKGEVGKMKLTDSQRVALARYLEEQKNRGEEMSAFFANVSEQLRGQRVFIFSQASYLFQASQKGLERGLSNVFAADSIGVFGGGGKDVVLPDNWEQLAQDFTGIRKWHTNYAMTEVCGPMPACPRGVYHIPPWILPFLLDPETGAALPRSGRQTGRFAALDLLPQTYWGGIISGDMVTIDWDNDCACGRKGAHIPVPVTRYAANVTGDDKITCAATVDNTDAALQKLLAG